MCADPVRKKAQVFRGSVSGRKGGYLADQQD